MDNENVTALALILGGIEPTPQQAMDKALLLDAAGVVASPDIAYDRGYQDGLGAALPVDPRA